MIVWCLNCISNIDSDCQDNKTRDCQDSAKGDDCQEIEQQIISEAVDNIQVHSDYYDSSEDLDSQYDKQDYAWH